MSPICNTTMCMVGPIIPPCVTWLCVLWALSEPYMYTTMCMVGPIYGCCCSAHTHTHGSGRPVQAQSWQPWDPWCWWWWWWYTSLNIGQLLPHNRLYQLVHLAHMPQLQPANRKICLIAGLSYWSREYSGNLMNILRKNVSHIQTSNILELCQTFKLLVQSTGSREYSETWLKFSKI